MVSKKSNFGEALSQVLRERNMTQGGLADTLGVSTAYVSSISTGKRNVSPDRIEAICARIGVPAEQGTRLHRAAALDA